MLHFEGDNDFPQAPALVWSQLTDATFLVSCIPRVESVPLAEPTVAKCVLRPGFSFIRGTLEVTLRVTEAVEPTSVRAQAHGKGIGSGNDVEAIMTLTPHDGGTRVHWTADITNLTGLIKAIPQGLIKASAQKVIAEVWETVREKLGGRSGGPMKQNGPGPSGPGPL
jgi:uncharacterized protein